MGLKLQITAVRENLPWLNGANEETQHFYINENSLFKYIIIFKMCFDSVNQQGRL